MIDLMCSGSYVTPYKWKAICRNWQRKQNYSDCNGVLRKVASVSTIFYFLQ